MLDAAGVVRLQNEYRLLKRGRPPSSWPGSTTRTAARSTRSARRSFVREIRQSRGRDAYILMLSHRNDELDLWANMGVQTVLCGHGHGGIVRLPFVGAVLGRTSICSRTIRQGCTGRDRPA